MNLESVALISEKEVRDARRNRWFVVLSILFASLALALSLLGLSGLGTLGISGFGRTTASLLNLILLIVPLMGLLLGAMSLANEREQGTLITLLAQPVSAGEILLGKFIGTAIALAGTVLFGFGLSGLVIAWYGGPAQLGVYLILLAYTLLLGLIYLAIGFCISVFSRKNATAISFALFLWFVFMFMSDLGLLGATLMLKLKPALLFWISLLNPSQAFRIAVVDSIQGNLELLGGVGAFAIDVFGNYLSLALSILMAAWVLFALGLALFLFRKRCIL